MKIGHNSVVSITYTLSDAQGELIERAQAPVTYLHGGYGNIFPRVEQALAGKSAGEGATVRLEPEDAFGDYDAERLRVESRDRFPEVLEVGMQFEGIPGDGVEAGEEAEIFTVTDIADGKVVLDANHPLAGIALVFECEVSEVRAATEEEIAHGHVHGPGGHHH
jgi:FKBP-type peptidyl-prolyl cis-trans isomerase SlyD